MKQDTQISYANQPIYLGIDVHKKQWTVTISTVHRVRRPVMFYAPFAKGIRKYLDNHFPGGIYYAAYEAGFSGFWPKHELEREGIRTIVVHTTDIPKTEKSRTQKTDKGDSRLICRSLRSKELTGIYIPSQQNIQDRCLVRERWNIAKRYRQIKNEIKSQLLFEGIAILDEPGRKHWTKRFLKWLKQTQEEHNNQALALKIERLEALRQLQLEAIRNIRTLARSERYKELVYRLMSVPGVAMLTAMQLITEIMDMNRFASSIESVNTILSQGRTRFGISHIVGNI
jgi:transposase